MCRSRQRVCRYACACLCAYLHSLCRRMRPKICTFATIGFICDKGTHARDKHSTDITVSCWKLRVRPGLQLMSHIQRELWHASRISCTCLIWQKAYPKPFKMPCLPFASLQCFWTNEDLTTSFTTSPNSHGRQCSENALATIDEKFRHFAAACLGQSSFPELPQKVPKTLVFPRKRLSESESPVGYTEMLGR